MRMFSRCLFLPVLAVAACGQRQATDSPSASVVIDSQPATVTANLDIKQNATPAQLAESPPFHFPPDRTGKELARVVTPNISQPVRTPRFGTEPQSRPIVAKLPEPDALAPANYIPPPLMPTRPRATTPADPFKKMPLDLGSRINDLPAKPVLPVAAVKTPRARDVNLPPPAPKLGRPVSDRVSSDDPTSESGNAVIAGGSVKTPLAPSDFLKVGIPDPFELSSQVKPRIPAAAEPSAEPIPVNPQRVK